MRLMMALFSRGRDVSRGVWPTAVADRLCVGAFRERWLLLALVESVVGDFCVRWRRSLSLGLSRSFSLPYPPLVCCVLDPYDLLSYAAAVADAGDCCEDVRIGSAAVGPVLAESG